MTDSGAPPRLQDSSTLVDGRTLRSVVAVIRERVRKNSECVWVGSHEHDEVMHDDARS